MPLPLTGSCFSKIQIGFTFLVPAHPGSPGKRAVKRVCVYIYIKRVSLFPESVLTPVQVGERVKKKGCAAVVNPARYKTELCRQFEEHGSCRYADKCQFAHGSAELRRLARHPKYKTEMCRTFHTTGFCPYGLRCHFIHNDDERRPAWGDPTALGGPVSPPSGDAGLLAGQPPLCRPVFRSSASPDPEQQRGRPILARSSTLPQRSSSGYPCLDQHVSFPSVSRRVRVDGDITTAVRALCA